MKNRISVLTILLLCAGIAASAQVTSRINGTVVDATGALLANATVNLHLPGSEAVVLTTKSGAQGKFTLPGVNAATYDLAVEADGFQKYLLKNLEVSGSRSTDLAEIRLQVGAVTQVVDAIYFLLPFTTTTRDASGVIRAHGVVLQPRG